VDLSEHMLRRPTGLVAYELLNEAVAPDPQDWNRVAMLAFRTVREREAERTIVLGSNRWNSALTYPDLEIPDDPHTILTYHYYHPMLLTHHTAHWWDGGAYTGPVHYPGKTVAEADLQGLPADVREIVERNNGEEWNRARMAQDFAFPLAAKKRTGYPLYCGEFGVYQPVSTDLRLAWYRDILSLFKENDICWANWDYKGGFAPVVKDGRPTEIVEVLLS
jgi:endoglucanase